MKNTLYVVIVAAVQKDERKYRFLKLRHCLFCCPNATSIQVFKVHNLLDTNWIVNQTVKR